MKRILFLVLALQQFADQASAFEFKYAPKKFNKKEYIVTLKEAQNSEKEIQNTLQSFAAKEISMVSGPEATVRLKFKDEAQAKTELKKLRMSGLVSSVSPNLYYRPALRMTSREVVQAKSFQFPLLTGLLSDDGDMSPVPSSFGSLPAVSLPVTQTPGSDAYAPQDWVLENIRFDKAQFGKAKKIIFTAVTDTGVDYNHEDLINAMWRKRGDQKEVGYDFAHGNNQPYDVLKFDLEGCMKDFQCRSGQDASQFLVNPGHGTHCAGHIGAVANNSLGIRGVGVGTKIMGLKFFYDFGEENAGAGDDAAAIKSIDYAVKNGARIISASWGGSQDRAEAESSELKKAIERARDAGVLMIIAAGNDGSNQDENDQPSYPAAYELENLIVVAATGQDDSLADFSNYGAKTVHLGAPGVKILSTTVGSKYSDSVGQYKDSQGKLHTLDWDGTSMATPVVAGAAALLWSRFPDKDYKWIKAQILNNVRKVTSLEGKVKTAGVLDLELIFKAVQ